MKITFCFNFKIQDQSVNGIKSKLFSKIENGYNYKNRFLKYGIIGFYFNFLINDNFDLNLYSDGTEKNSW